MPGRLLVTVGAVRKIRVVKRNHLPINFVVAVGAVSGIMTFRRVFLLMTIRANLVAGVIEDEQIPEDRRSVASAACFRIVVDGIIDQVTGPAFVEVSVDIDVCIPRLHILVTRYAASRIVTTRELLRFDGVAGATFLNAYMIKA
jgi:hypothetical protein